MDSEVQGRRVSECDPAVHNDGVTTTGNLKWQAPFLS